MTNIRFLRFSSIYKNYYPIIYSKYILDHQHLDYAAHYKKFMNLKIAEFDSYKTNLESLGGFNCMEVIGNNEKLQKKWAEENNINYPAYNWKKEIAIAQIKYFRPHILMVGGFIFTPEERAQLKKKYDIKLLLAWDGTLYTDPKKFLDIDLLLTCIVDIKRKYQRIGKNTVVLPFSFEKNVLKSIDVNKKREVSFCGSLFYKYHKKRAQNLQYLIQNGVPINLFIGNIKTGNYPFSKSILRELVKARFDFAKILYQFQKINQGVIFGRYMFQLLAQSKITLNFHGDNVLQAGNMRLIEATGSGACLVTDWKSNIVNYFESDKEIVTFKSKEEALEKIQYLLENEKEREKIAYLGQQKTFTHYSGKKRMEILKSILLKKLS